MKRKIEKSKLQSTLQKLVSGSVRSEKIAADLEVSYSTVRSWIAGIRKPKKATILAIERFYGVKIL